MRWKRRGVMRTASGAVIPGASVQVFIVGSTTPADIYETATGGTAITQVSADTQGRYEYYVDAADYSAASRFKEVITKGSTSTTLDNIPIVRWDPTVNQSLAGDLNISGTGKGIVFPDGSRQTTNATPGAGVSNAGDVSIAADTDADGSGEITLSTHGSVRAKVPNAGGFEVYSGGAWRKVATQDGTETLSNKTLTTPTVGDFTNAGHDHSDAANGGALSAPNIFNPILNGSLSGTAIKDEDSMASNSATAVATQQSIKAYVDTRPQLITEWSMPNDDHPFLNAENAVTQGKATIKLPADKEAWVHGEFIAKTSGQDINVNIDYMMSTYDANPVNWGLAYAAGKQWLCDVPWKPSEGYQTGDIVCPTTPNGHAYQTTHMFNVPGSVDSGISLYSGSTIAAGFKATSASFSGSINIATSYFWLYKVGSPTGNIVVRAFNGAGGLIFSSNTVDVSTLGNFWGWVQFNFSPVQALSSNAEYQFVVEYTGGDASNYIRVGARSDGYPGYIGRIYTSGPTWSDQTWAPLAAIVHEYTSGSTEPTWPTTLGSYVGDNGMLWLCVAIGNYKTLSLTIETAPATAWTEGSKIFTIPGTAINAGDPVNIVLIRKPHPNEHSGDLHLIRAMAQPAGA